jgi:hypothetical protein
MRVFDALLTVFIFTVAFALIFFTSVGVTAVLHRALL